MRASCCLSLQAGGWLRGNREGIEMLIDTAQSMLELINNRIAEDRERQRSKFGRVKPLWAIEGKEDQSQKTMDELNSFDKQDIRADSQKRECPCWLAGWRVWLRGCLFSLGF